MLPVASYAGDLPCQLDGAGGGELCADLLGRVALVTGASTGIGRRLADRLVEGGVMVVGTSRTPDTYLSGGEPEVASTSFNLLSTEPAGSS